MDLIRIFIDTAFSKVADVFLKEIDTLTGKIEGLMLNEGMFVDVCRRHHPELSDDQIRMIYHLYKDEWAYSEEELEGAAINEDDNLTPDIFNVVFRFSSEMLRLHNQEPMVKFNHLFRWREVTLNIGEDLPVAAYYAYKNRHKPFKRDWEDTYVDTEVDEINFCSWPTILHNDNPNLKYLFLKLRLTELHSHLYASTDNFSISWVALMNKIKGRKGDFDKIGKVQDESRYRVLSRDLYSYVILACSIRLKLWRKINGRESSISTDLNEIADNMDKIAEDLQNEIFKENRGEERLDYISSDKGSPLSVIGGERKFLYCVLRQILSDDDVTTSFLFYRYLLAKNKLRSFLIQVNSNKGFANFKRFQDLKSVFLKRGKYSMLVSRLAVWEASEFNYTDSFETRIAPADNFRDAKHRIVSEAKNISYPYSDEEKSKEPDWSFLFHFIKRPDNIISPDTVRNGEVRKKVRLQSVILKNLLSPEMWQSAGQSCLSRLKGIDAASSEIGCRPEIFSQAFRYLKDAGYAATFHAGEDFYDIADGLRAIQEAIDFLSLEAGDRIGHALALGLDSYEFYRERHNYIALPVQWMLDNVVWLYFKSREANVAMEPNIENFLLSTFRSLVRRIGYEEMNGDKTEITDYYQSMKLRGDAPETYFGKDVTIRRGISQSWCHYDRRNSSEIAEIRRWNVKSKELVQSYLRNDGIRKRGSKIASFQVPSGYPKLIRDIQDEMIKDISKRQLGIECCPSSNYKIGYFKRYDQHPIFRFFPINEEKTHYPLPVTVNTDDLGVFSTSLPNEFSLLALALMKMKDKDGNHMYSTGEVYAWIERVIRNNEKFAFEQIANNEMMFYPDNDL